MDEAPKWLSLFLAWFPMLAFVATLFWLIRRNNRNMTSKSGKGYLVLMEELIFEKRRQNDLVGRLVENQGDRIKKLEEK